MGGIAIASRSQVSELGVDMLSVVGHKFGAPKGVAALYVKRELDLPPMILGGGQESGRRAGTENVMLIAGMGKAAEVRWFARVRCVLRVSRGRGVTEASSP